MDPQPVETIVDDFKTQQMVYHEKACIRISNYIRYKKARYVIYPMTCRDYRQYLYSLERNLYYLGTLDAKDIAETDEKIKTNKKYFSADILVQLLRSKGYDVVACKDERTVSCFGNVTPEFNYFRISKRSN